jgi:hypothetical protein
MAPMPRPIDVPVATTTLPVGRQRIVAASQPPAA